MFYTLISVETWEQLVVVAGWTQRQYVVRMTAVLKRVLCDGA